MIRLACAGAPDGAKPSQRFRSYMRASDLWLKKKRPVTRCAGLDPLGPSAVSIFGEQHWNVSVEFAFRSGLPSRWNIANATLASRRSSP